MNNIPPSDIIWQRIEGALVFACTLTAVIWLGGPLSWWVLVLIFFAPDLSFLSYLAGPRIGSVAYNVVHIYGFGTAVIGIALMLSSEILLICGLLWLGHSGFDRVFGYGLKRPEGFKSTHMGDL